MHIRERERDQSRAISDRHHRPETHMHRSRNFFKNKKKKKQKTKSIDSHPSEHSHVKTLNARITSQQIHSSLQPTQSPPMAAGPPIHREPDPIFHLRRRDAAAARSEGTLRRRYDPHRGQNRSRVRHPGRSRPKSGSRLGNREGGSGVFIGKESVGNCDSVNFVRERSTLVGKQRQCRYGVQIASTVRVPRCTRASCVRASFLNL